MIDRSSNNYWLKHESYRKQLLAVNLKLTQALQKALDFTQARLADVSGYIGSLTHLLNQDHEQLDSRVRRDKLRPFSFLQFYNSQPKTNPKTMKVIKMQLELRGEIDRDRIEGFRRHLTKEETYSIGELLELYQVAGLSLYDLMARQAMNPTQRPDRLRELASIFTHLSKLQGQNKSFNKLQTFKSLNKLKKQIEIQNNFQVCKKKIDRPKSKVSEEVKMNLIKLHDKYGPNWQHISYELDMPTEEVYQLWRTVNPQLNRKGGGPDKDYRWKLYEDVMLIVLHNYFGEKWIKIAQFMQIRNDVQIRERYKNILQPKRPALSLVSVAPDRLLSLIIDQEFRWNKVAVKLKQAYGVHATDNAIFKTFCKLLNEIPLERILELPVDKRVFKRRSRDCSLPQMIGYYKSIHREKTSDSRDSTEGLGKQQIEYCPIRRRRSRRNKLLERKTD